MIIFPAIDLYEGKAVRLYRGDYAQMTVYSEHPEEIGSRFVSEGATHVHLVDLEGARDGTTPNLETALRLKRETGLFCEIGGGIRSMDTVRTYLENGLDRVILGTAAVRDPAFLEKALEDYGSRIAVGADVRDGRISVQGWTEDTGLSLSDFCERMRKIGVQNLICTDISRDGAMRGTNRELYSRLSREAGMNITASGGVSSLEDVIALRKLNLYGAIIGKAWYTGTVSLKEAVERAK